MEETILKKGSLCNIKKVRNIIWAIGTVFSGLLAIYTIVTLIDYINDDTWKDWMTNTIVTFTVVTLLVLIVFIVVGSVIYYGLSKIEIVVTNKRVYGKTMFGKQVDLPLDSISAMGMGMFNGIAVATSSGKINFLGISNRNEIHKTVSDLLLERQSVQKKEVTHVTQMANSSADELKKFKELFDSGIISQEEYETKKKQLLGL